MNRHFRCRPRVRWAGAPAIFGIAGLLAGSPSAQDWVPVPYSVWRAVGSALPETTARSSTPLSTPIRGAFEVTKDCTIRTVFLWEGAGYRNAIGYFTYTKTAAGIEVGDVDLLFRNASFFPAGSANIGDTVPLRNASGTARQFRAGERVAFFLIADGYPTESDLVRGWTFNRAGVPGTSPTANAGLGRGCYTSFPEWNPEYADDPALASHVAVVAMDGDRQFLDGRDYFLCGFEDLDRRQSADDDFNDCVLAIDASVPNALAPVDFVFRPGDPDRDGVVGIRDLFPNDRERAFQYRFPSHGYAVLAFEDQYPDSLDTDYNDAVLAFSALEIRNGRNRVKDLIADYHIIGRGASYDHAFGVHLPRLSRRASGSVRLERFVSGRSTPEAIEARTVAGVLAAQRRIHGLFRSTRAAIPSPDPRTPFANTEPSVYGLVPAASVRLAITFDSAVPQFGGAPYDPFLMVALDVGNADIHLPGRTAFADRPANLPIERGRTAFIDANGNPWAMLLPTAWRFPLEGVPIRVAYPQFEAWRDSHGKTSTQWFLNPTSQPDKVSAPVETLIPKRDWTLLPPPR